MFFKHLERVVEITIFQARWLLAPIFLGLAGSLFLLIYKYFMSFWHMVERLRESSEEEFTVEVLGLVDHSMLATLVVMVLISGYESSVSKLQVGADQQELSWLGKVDSAALKLKIASSIVAISSINLLKNYLADTLETDRLHLLMTGHMVFVMSLLFLGVTDWLHAKAKH